MEQKDLQQLANIYNTLLTIHTNGQDSFIYTDIMRNFEAFIINKQKQLTEKEKEE